MQLLEAAGVRAEIRVDSGEYTDPLIEFDGTGIGVTINEETYCAYTSCFTSEIRYSDGSGDQASQELIPLGETSLYMDKPIITAIKELVNSRIMDLLDHELDKSVEKG